MTIGEKLKELRLKNKMSQEELATKLGVTRQAVSKWEQNLALPDTNNLISIAKIFNVKVDELVNYNTELSNDNTNVDAIKNNDNSSNNNETNLDKNENKEIEDIKNTQIYKILSSVTFLICLIIFILVGMYAPNGWNYSWIIWLLFPTFLSLFESIKRKKVSIFLFPVLITAIYLFIGMFFKAWHPYWLLFLLTPIYYLIAEAIDKNIIFKKKE